jgi:hypothetical protein
MRGPLNVKLIDLTNKERKNKGIYAMERSPWEASSISIRQEIPVCHGT